MFNLFSLFTRFSPKWLDIFPGHISQFSKIKDSESQRAVTSTSQRVDSCSKGKFQKGKVQKRLCGETALWGWGYNNHGSDHYQATLTRAFTWLHPPEPLVKHRLFPLYRREVVYSLFVITLLRKAEQRFSSGQHSSKTHVWNQTQMS